MMLTTKGRYAVMALVDIAINNEDGPVSLAEVAGRQGITIAYLEQLFSKLRKCGLVESVRGPGGGYLLSRSVEDITIAEIINAADESLKMTRCSTEGCSIKGAKCLTHDLWDGLGNQIHHYLDSLTLGDVCNGNLKRAYNSDNEFIGARA